MSWSEESEVKGGGTKSENTDQATEFVKVQSRNSQRYNRSLPLFVPHMRTGMPAVFYTSRFHRSLLFKHGNDNH